MQDYNRGIRVNRYYPGTYNYRACALADFEKGAELKKDDPYGLAGQAATHYAMGDVDAAKALWRRTLERESDYADVQEFADEFMPAKGFMDAVRKVAALAED
jgi:hypothetical protein